MDMIQPPRLWVDADACAYKEELIEIAKRHRLEITFVSNAPIKSIQNRKGIDNLLTNKDFDAVDDQILKSVSSLDLVWTADLGLAKKLLDIGVKVCGSQGKAYSLDGIGEAIAHRNLHMLLREEQGGLNHKEISKRGKSTKARKMSDFKSEFHNFLVNNIQK